MTDTTTLALEREGSRLEVILDSGKVNACGSKAIGDLEALAALLREDGDITSLIFRSEKVSSSGKPIFVAGADVTERVGWTDDDVIAHVRRQRRALLALQQAPVFTMVLVDGLALGLGTELMLAFDYRIATARASFGLPETGLGIIPGALGSAILASRIGVNHALRLGCTGETIQGEEAARIGLVDELVEDQGAALERARGLADSLALKSPRAVAAFKASVLDGLGLDLSARVSIERRRYETQVRNGDAARGREAFKDIREGRAPSWPKR